MTPKKDEGSEQPKKPVDVEDIEKVVINLLSNNGVFYASLLSQMTRIATDKIPTLGVTIRNGRIELYWNPEFLEQLKTVKEKRAVLEHECMHIVMDHISRSKDRDPQLFNIAADLAINQLISDLPKDCVTLDKFPNDFKLPPKSMAEVYYDILYKNADKMEITDNGDGTSHVKVKDGNGKVKSEFDIGNPDTHEKWGQSDGADTTHEVVKQAVERAKEQTERQRGETPAGLEDYIEDLLRAPVIPWWMILRKWVAMRIKAGHKPSWKRPNRRYGEEQKGKLPDRKIAITIAIDTSGSVSDEDFQEFVDEIRGIQAIHKTDIYMIECDAEIQKEYKLKPHTKVDTKFKGRGGTSTLPVFKLVEEKHLPTDLLIYFTDMCVDFPPKKPPYPVLWVSVTDQETAPFGTVLSIPKHRPKDAKRR